MQKIHLLPIADTARIPRLFIRSSKPVLVVPADGMPPPNVLSQQLLALSCPTIILRLEERRTPDLRQYCVVLVLGSGPHRENGNVASAICTLLRRVLDVELPLLCVGNQWLAKVLGASCLSAQTPAPGFFDLPLTPHALSDPLFQGFSGYQRILWWQQSAFTVPPGATLLAGSSTTAHTFRFGTFAYSLPSHLGFTRETLLQLIRQTDADTSDTPNRDQASLAHLQQQSRLYWPTYQVHSRLLCENIVGLITARLCSAKSAIHSAACEGGV
jgi:GMP synthase-like glutamine amidotransferase